MSGKKGKKTRRAASNVILVCLIAIALVSGYKVYQIASKYFADRNAYDSITEDANAIEFTGDIDFDKLAKKNSDVVAWIYLKDSKINYPIVKAPNNSKYLSTLFNGEWGEAGTLFTDCATVNPFHQFNTIVYGHHRKDGTMFQNLKLYKDSEYVKDHSQFELILPDGKYHLLVCAFLNEVSDCKVYTNNVSTDSSKQAYIDWINANAMYTTDVDMSINDRIVALSTCAYEFDNARYIVIGKMVPWEDESESDTDKANSED